MNDKIDINNVGSQTMSSPAEQVGQALTRSDQKVAEHAKTPKTVVSIAQSDAFLPDRKGRGPLTFVRRPRAKKTENEVVFGIRASDKRKLSVQFLKPNQQKSYVRVSNRKARFPPTGTWPIEMRADTLAAYLDFATTRQLCKSIARGEAPAPNATRGVGNDIELVWYFRSVESFVARRNHFSKGKT